jgi:perosamine synthetase
MIPLFKVHMPRSVLAPLKKTLFSGFIGEGPCVKTFEQVIGDYIGNPFVLTTNSCTSAIQLALRLANVGIGDEVISTPMTCTATNEPIVASGAKIVWADVEPDTGNISPRSIEQKITHKTKAILVVHWGGLPVDLARINRIARMHGIKVIEDAAHAFGAEYHQKKIGCHSDFICFSFQAIKHITTVDGGALLCKSKKDFSRGKLLRWYGINRETNRKDFRCEDDIIEWGYKFHMNDVAATLGIEQMKYINGILIQRRAQADNYYRRLNDVPGLRFTTRFTDRLSSFWLFTILVEGQQSFMEKMKRSNIMVSKVHARNDTHTMFKLFKTRLPGVDTFYGLCMCIPIGYWIRQKDQNYIIDTIRKGW